MCALLRQEGNMKELIYNQKKIPKEKWRYGFRSSAATGCGWIATHNALRLMGDFVKPENLIRYYERSLPLINGNFGTFLLSPVAFFKRRGFGVRVTARRDRFDEAVRSSDACILFYYWRKKFKFGSHYTTVQYQDGKFLGYNTFRNSVGPDDYGGSLEHFLRQHKFFLPVLIAIRNKKGIPEKAEK